MVLRSLRAAVFCLGRDRHSRVWDARQSCRDTHWEDGMGKISCSYNSLVKRRIRAMERNNYLPNPRSGFSSVDVPAAFCSDVKNMLVEATRVGCYWYLRVFTGICQYSFVVVDNHW